MVDIGPRDAAEGSAVGVPVVDGSAGESSRGGEPDDVVLLRRIAAHDFTVFDLFVDRYKLRLVAYIRSRVGDGHHAEDVAQEVFMRVFRAAREGRIQATDGKVVAWVLAITRNCVADHLRERRRKPVTLMGDCGVNDVDQTNGSQTRDPLQAAMAADRRRQARALLSRLPPVQRDVITLRMYGQFTYLQIAEVLACPVATVKSRMRYGLKRIEEMLREAEFVHAS